jgi:hypothetical protein
MPELSDSKWERLPDRRKFVDIERLRVPEGWLVDAAVRGGPRLSALFYYPDAAHEWQHLVASEPLGTCFVEWEKLPSRALDGFAARLTVPGGWFVYVDREAENSTAQIVFVPDGEHSWDFS